MNINEEFRHPLIVKLQPSTHFRRIGFQEVTVQVDELGGITSTQFFRSVLVDTVGRTEVFMTIHIEYRNEKETDIVQNIDVLLVHNHIAKENHAGILSIRLSRMDTRFYQDYHTSLLTNLHGVLQTVLVYNHQRQVTSLRAGAKRGNLHHRRVIGQFLEPCHRFFKTGSLHKVRLLTISYKILLYGLLSTRHAHQQTDHST